MVQLFGIAVVGGAGGIIIIQLSQTISICGGVAGYLLVLNTTLGEVVEPEGRTAAFGRLQGCVMLGIAIGYLVGGNLVDIYGISAPWYVSIVTFMVSCVYAACFTPYLSPKIFADRPGQNRGLRAFFGPLLLMAPSRLRLESGRMKKHYGVTLLVAGVFFGVLATGYAPALIQMYATSAFHFSSSENGYLMALNSSIRGLFLIFAFPRLIAAGRRYVQRQSKSNNLSTEAVRSVSKVRCESLPRETQDSEPAEDTLAEQEPAIPREIAAEDSGRTFDLFFVRWSLLMDAFVTAFTASATKSWHIYAAGLLLPLASGTAPASKGVITEMCPPSHKSEALQTITLVENIGQLATLGLFGYVFSAFAQIGQEHLTFYCNAAVALLAVAVLCFSRFPPSGSKLEDDDE
ncbi:MFS general substrate transporter [Teratosphaeria nubilosa]|uniref:MFS general substrate transporter n=1 Tax=Teratosphaeria nubilosa TaxID=161662 RepID=A0A6G1LG06_9PEZI|nr:MFS general substrate transporter [Teratosphaeria nubilosa]